MDNEGPRILLPPEARQKISAAWEEVCRRYKSPALRAIEFQAVLEHVKFEYPECFKNG